VSAVSPDSVGFAEYDDDVLVGLEQCFARDDGAVADQGALGTDEEKKEKKKKSRGPREVPQRLQWARNPFLVRIHSIVLNSIVRQRYTKSAAESLRAPNLGPVALTPEADLWLPLSRRHIRQYVADNIHRTKTGCVVLLGSGGLLVVGAESFPVVLRSHGKPHQLITVSYLPTKRWIRNLLATPAYVCNVKPLAEQCRGVPVLYFAGYAETRACMTAQFFCKRSIVFFS